MAVRFRCPCGAVLHVDEKHVDSIKPCPHCHVNLRIPHAATERRDCAMCKQTIPSSHTIWVRGRRICWKCMPPGTVRIDMKAFEQHRKLQVETIRKARSAGLNHFQYHSPFEAAHNEVQVTADEVIFSDKDWDKITPAWKELGLIPFDMGSFMGVSLNVQRFSEQAEESKKYLDPLIAFVKLADELPMASIPKDAGLSALVQSPSAHMGKT
jgi:hypothetical protein